MYLKIKTQKVICLYSLYVNYFYFKAIPHISESPKRVDEDVDQGRNEERARRCLRWLKRSLARENLLKARTKILKTAKIVSKERK